MTYGRRLQGNLYQATAALPAGAKLIVRKGQRLAEWKDAKGKTRTAPLTAAGDRITVEAGTYSAKYRDGSGVVRKVATGCRDKTAAESVLADLERRAELVKAGVLTAAEDTVADHRETSLPAHFAAYLVKLQAQGTSTDHRANVRRALERLAAGCRFGRLGDLTRESLERWLVSQEKAGMGPRTRNTYRAAAVAFVNWCVETGRLLVNPLCKVPKAAEDVDLRRQRRALTEEELRRLLYVAQRRPLAEYGRLAVRKDSSEVKGKRDTWKMLPLGLRDLDAATERARARLAKNPRLVGRLVALGRERALVYKTLVLTGLRRGELASLSVGQLSLDTDPSYLSLAAADAKNREAATIPLRADLAADLWDWLAAKAQTLREAAGNAPTIRFDPEAVRGRERNQGDAEGFQGRSCQQATTVHGLPADTPVFRVPRGLVNILDRDLLLAGIPKRDERGRTVDVHALRHTFATLLSKGGVAPRTAQAAMRHSDVNLTMQRYVDPKVLDVCGALDSLPALPLAGQGGQAGETAREVRATGTENAAPESIHTRSVPSLATPRAMGPSPTSPLVPVLVPTTGQRSTMQSILDKAASKTAESVNSEATGEKVLPVKHLRPLSTLDNGRFGERETGFEPATSSLGTTPSRHAKPQTSP